MSSLFRQSLKAFLPAALILALLSGLAAFVAMDRLYGEVMADTLGATVSSLAAAVPAGEIPSLSAGGAEAKAWAGGLDLASGFRVTLIRRDGSVAADSRADPLTMENHAARPEVAAALSGKTGFARRISATIGKELFYAATPIRAGQGREIALVLRIAVDLPAMGSRVAPARLGLALIVLLLVALSILAAALFSRSLAVPLGRLATAARRVGAGSIAGQVPARSTSEGSDADLAELRRVVRSEGPDEVRLLGESLLSMATELEGRAQAESLASRERAAILDGMAEAVFALDAERRLKLANRSGRELFALDMVTASGRPRFLEAIRSVELDGIASECLASGSAIEREIALYSNGGERWFAVVATPLLEREGPAAGGAGERTRVEGLVLVMNDITRLRKLERVRKDFVSSVSHELRTPVQIVKGFVETLQSGGLSAADTKRYLEIIERNATRMENLIGDLLALARLEQDGGGTLELVRCDVAGVVAEAVEEVASRAKDRGMAIEVDVSAGTEAEVNEGLIVQALINLLDNAVKYCPVGTPIRVEASMEDGPERPGRRLVLTVADKGKGIPARDLPRLFERFYTVDRTRSRELGGTGLGLAIVKHIALAHGGEVAVESWEGEGTRFTLRLPA
jgi:two-component system phosphate regulon sensor histidine kinase PhoR